MKKASAETTPPEPKPEAAAGASRSRRRPSKRPAAPAALPDGVASPEVVVASAPAVAPAPVEPPAAIPVAPVASAPAVEAGEMKKKKKTKVVRDSFTMPESDYAKIAELKKKSLEAGISIKKSELLRAGLHALEALPPAKLKALLGGVENIKTGRPAGKGK